MFPLTPIKHRKHTYYKPEGLPVIFTSQPKQNYCCIFYKIQVFSLLKRGLQHSLRKPTLSPSYLFFLRLPCDHQMCKSLESELFFDIMKISMDLEIRILPHSSRHTQSNKLFVSYSQEKL